MLFKLSLKNIKKSVKDYAIYFFTLLLGVAIFYIFNAISTQATMLKMTEDQMETVKILEEAMSWLSVFVAIILGLLIVYASRFLMKRRNQEFATYMILGMGKRKVSLILFLETLLIGVISLIVGLAIGIGLSQLMSVLVGYMFEADMSKFEFVFSGQAAIKSIIYFGGIYLFVVLFNTISVNKYSIMKLLQSSSRNEEVKLKNPIISAIVLIVAIGVLIYDYRIVLNGLSLFRTAKTFSFVIISGSIATGLLFWGISGIGLRLIKRVKGVYYKGINSFVFRQISSKINTMVVSVSVICLMLFVTITMLSSALAVKTTIDKNLKELTPVDVQATMFLENSNENRDLTEILKNRGYNLSDLKDISTYSTYSSKDFTLRDTMTSGSIKAGAPEIPENIMKISDYNRVAKLYGKSTYDLKGNQYLVVANIETMIKSRNESLKTKNTIEINGKTYTSATKEVVKGFITMESMPTNEGIIVLPDKAVEGLRCDSIGLVANYNANTKAQKEAIEKNLHKHHVENTEDMGYIIIDTKKNIINASTGLSTLFTFIALYMGLIFLMSSVAILALKELSEASDNRKRFNVLRKIGVDEKEINRALRKEIGIFFVAPLIVAIIHSIVGIKFCMNVLNMVIGASVGTSILMTALLFLVIYGGYYIITYKSSRNIIRNRNS